MRVIVGCEFSQIVTKAFRDKGHEAYSCDFLPTEGNPAWHFQEDILELLKRERFDLGIFHPPCTHLCVSGARWFKDKQIEQEAALEFVRLLLNAAPQKIALENPVGIISSRIRKPDQVIQPWQYGHGETKATCLWLKNLPPLQPTHRKDDLFCEQEPQEREARIHMMPPGPNRWKERSRTFAGIAQAMAAQWTLSPHSRTAN